MTTLSPKTDAIVISQYQVLLDDIQEAQSSKVESFDYESPKGNKAARSYIYSLRLLRGRIESARKDAKAYALEYGRKVDSQAKELSSQVEALILPHQEAIDAIARREAERVAALQSRLDAAVRLGEVAADADSAQIKAQLKQLERETLVGLEEFEGKVAAAVTRSRQALQSALTLAEAAEAQAAEQARVLAEAQAQAEQAREAQRQREAQARAEAEAQAAAAAAIAEAEAKAAAATAEAQAAAQAQANAERRAAEAEAQAATAVQAIRRTILPEPVIDWVPPVQPTPAALEHFIERLLESMGGKSRDAIAEAIALGTLHPAVRVDWAQVCTSTELRHG